MTIRIESLGFKASASLKDFIKEKAGKLEKFYNELQEIEVTLLNEVKGANNVIICTLNIRIPGKDEYVKGKSSIFEDAVMKAVENAKTRLKTRKTKKDVTRKGKKLKSA